MTYDPDRDAKAPVEMNPNVRPEDGPSNGMGLGVWFAILAVLAIASLFFFSADRDGSVATNNRPTVITPSTTGSGATAPKPAMRDVSPGANIPGATQPPSPPRQ